MRRTTGGDLRDAENIGLRKGMASPTAGIPEWRREVPGEKPAAGGGKAA